MNTPRVTPAMGTLFLVNGILGVVTAIPFFIWLSIPLSLGMLGIAIYQLVVLPKGERYLTSPILITVAVGLELVGIIGLVATGVVTMAGVSEFDHLTDSQAASFVGSLLLWFVLLFASWVVRIVGTVYAFLGQTRVKRELMGAMQATAAASQADPSVMTDTAAPEPVPVPASASASAVTPNDQSLSASASQSVSASQSGSENVTVVH